MVRFVFLKDPSDQCKENRFQGGQGEKHGDELANNTTIEIKTEKNGSAFYNYNYILKRADPVQ